VGLQKLTQLRRISIPRTPVNKALSDALGSQKRLLDTVASLPVS
jgi:hypothetical protein